MKAKTEDFLVIVAIIVTFILIGVGMLLFIKPGEVEPAKPIVTSRSI